MGAERTLTDADVDAIAERLAEKLRRPAKVEAPKPKRKTRDEVDRAVEMRLRRAGIR